MSRDTSNPTKWHVCPGLRRLRSASVLCRLIRVFIGYSQSVDAQDNLSFRTCHVIGVTVGSLVTCMTTSLNNNVPSFSVTKVTGWSFCIRMFDYFIFSAIFFHSFLLKYALDSTPSQLIVWKGKIETLLGHVNNTAVVVVRGSQKLCKGNRYKNIRPWLSSFSSNMTK